MKSEPLDPWIEGYLDYLRDVRRINHRTLIDMRCTLRRVSLVMQKLRPGAAPWKLGLDDYLKWMNRERDRGRSEGSLGKDISHIRGLLEYSFRSGRADRNVLDGFKIQDESRGRMPFALELEETRRLLEACRGGTRQERRKRLIILLLYGCGLRTRELCDLDTRDVDIERQEIFVRCGKGSRERRIPVPQSVWTQLLAYLAETKPKRGALFRTQAKKRRIPSGEICLIVKETAQRAGIEKKITARTLRHTFATHLMDEGIAPHVIASLMGHRSPRESGVYLHALAGRREEAVKLLDKKKQEKEGQRK